MNRLILVLSASIRQYYRGAVYLIGEILGSGITCTPACEIRLREKQNEFHIFNINWVSNVFSGKLWIGIDIYNRGRGSAVNFSPDLKKKYLQVTLHC